MKKILKKKVIGFVLCSIMLLGSALSVHADTPVCGGNHSFSNVRVVGIHKARDLGYHMHDGQNCNIYVYNNVYLQRCACGAEQTWIDHSTSDIGHSVK